MARVVAIHGIAQTYEGAATLKETKGWHAAMNSGLEEAGHALLRDEDLDVVFYGSLFRKAGTRAGSIPYLTAGDVEPGFEEELLTLWWRTAAKLSEESRRTDEADPLGEASDIQVPDFQGRARTPEMVQRALHQLSKSRFFRAFGERALIFGLKQVRRYLHDPELKHEVLKRVEQKVTGETRLIVAHSLGTVVAYEALCAHPEWRIHSLITLGSPLGIPNLVFEALTPPPVEGQGRWPGVTSWVNIADQGDLVALVKELSSLFDGGRIEDQTVYNGWESHNVVRRPARPSREVWMPDNEPERRYLIAFGASKYDHLEDFPPRQRVVDDVNRVAAFFTSEAQGYQRVLGDKIGLNASAATIRAEVKQWFASPERRSTDRVVFYFAGHGDTAGRLGRHYLFTKTSDLKDPSDTAIASLELPEWFFEGENQRPQNLLVILDTCYSGKGAGQAAAVAASATEAIFTETSEGLWIIASARPLDEAAEGGFVEALLEITEDSAWGDRSQPFINPLAVIDAMNKWFKDHQLLQRADAYAAAARAMPEFIRNTKYRPGQTGLVLTDEAHWDPKARGAETITEVGWYFTGRHAALRVLVEFLTGGHSDHRARLVTGGPGSGKSAVLARLVTCAHPETRKRMEEAGVLKDVAPEELAPPNSIDVVIHARGQSIDQVAAAIAGACDLADSDLATVLKALSAREKLLRIVIDALDEAQKPDALDLKLLRPLAELPAVRLIVGSRCPRKDRPPLGERAEVLDLDDKYFYETDIADYVVRRLQRLDPATPYTGLGQDEIAPLAQAVAHKAQKSFLFARVVSRRLADANRPIETRSPDWQRQLPSSLSEAFEQDLARFPKDQHDIFFNLMVPLAYARGRGLPWQNLWSRLASAIAGHEYTTATSAI